MPRSAGWESLHMSHADQEVGIYLRFPVATRTISTPPGWDARAADRRATLSILSAATSLYIWVEKRRYESEVFCHRTRPGLVPRTLDLEPERANHESAAPLKLWEQYVNYYEEPLKLFEPMSKFNNMVKMYPAC